MYFARSADALLCVASNKRRDLRRVFLGHDTSTPCKNLGHRRIIYRARIFLEFLRYFFSSCFKSSAAEFMQ